MPIIIRNITPNPKPTGLHEYEVSINNAPVFRFKHFRENSLAGLFETAAREYIKHKEKMDKEKALILLRKF